MSNTKNQVWEASENNDNISFVLENVRIAFSRNGLSFFEPEEFMGSAKYKADFIVEDEKQQDMMQDIIELLVKENFGGKMPSKCFYKDGNDNVSKKTGDIYDGFEDNTFVRANRSEDQEAPEVFAMTQELIESHPDNRILKDGCYGNVMLRAYASKKWDTIGCTIEAVLYTDEGESFSVETKVSKNKDAKARLFGSAKAKTRPAEKVFAKRG